MDHQGGILASLSGRYATAWFELAREREDLAALERDAATLNTALSQSPDLAAMIASPLVGREAQQAAIAGVARALGLSPLTHQFLGTLAANQRLNRLPQVLKGVNRLTEAARGEIRATVTSAGPLSATQQKTLAEKLAVRTGRKVKIDCAVDPEILGGLKVQIGSELIDASLRTQLNTLAHAMKG